MNWRVGKTESWVGAFLVIYLFLIGFGAAVMVVVNFPEADANGELAFAGLSGESALLALALMAGLAGSFVHAGQSLVSYLGNRAFKLSWTAWYLLRPWIGGTLGVAIYVAFRAGIVSPGDTLDAVNPYGVAIFGLLGGWFSKITADKLQEVWETLFTSNQDDEREDKLQAADQPVVTGVEPPPPVPSGATKITIEGDNLLDGATVLLGKEELQATLVGDKLEVDLGGLSQRPAAGVKVALRVRNPEGSEPLSEAFEITFG